MVWLVGGRIPELPVGLVGVLWESCGSLVWEWMRSGCRYRDAFLEGSRMRVVDVMRNGTWREA